MKTKPTITCAACGDIGYDWLNGRMYCKECWLELKTGRCFADIANHHRSGHRVCRNHRAEGDEATGYQENAIRAMEDNQ